MTAGRGVGPAETKWTSVPRNDEHSLPISVLPPCPARRAGPEGSSGPLQQRQTLWTARLHKFAIGKQRFSEYCRRHDSKQKGGGAFGAGSVSIARKCEVFLGILREFNPARLSKQCREMKNNEFEGRVVCNGSESALAGGVPIAEDRPSRVNLVHFIAPCDTAERRSAKPRQTTEHPHSNSANGR